MSTVNAKRRQEPRPTTTEIGCSLHDDCFTCPFPECSIGNKRAVLTLKKKKRARELKESGLDANQIAKEMGKSVRTINRWLD